MANKHGYTSVIIPPEIKEEIQQLKGMPEYYGDTYSALIRKMIRLGLDQVKAKKK